MRTPRPQYLILAVWLWLGATGFADTVKLRDGTVLDGSITSEDATTLTLDVELAGGTIHQTRTVPKAEVAEIKRLSDAEKKQAQMEKDFQAALKYRLDPVRSLAVPQYDQIISNTFRRFLTDYPGSAHGDAIAARLREWQAERDRVAGGEAKYAGEWRPAAEVAAVVEKDNGQQWLKTAQLLIAQNKPEQALPYLQGAAGLKTQPDLAADARVLMTQTYQQLISTVNGQVGQLQQGVAAARRRVEQAQQTVAKAEAAAQRPIVSQPTSGKKTGGYQAMGSDTKTLANALAKTNQARDELTKARNDLLVLENQVTAAQQKADRLQASARQAGVKLVLAAAGDQVPVTPNATEPVSVTTTQTTTITQAESVPPAGSRDLLEQMGEIVQWLKDHWLLLLIGAVVALWLVGHWLR